MEGFVGLQNDFEQYSKIYWESMEGTKQWNTGST